MSTVEDLAKRSVVLKGFSDLLTAEVVNQFIFDRTGGFPHDVCSLEHLSWPDGGIRWLALLQSDIDQLEILKQPTSVIKYRDQEYRVSVDVPSVCIIPEHWTHHSHQMADNKETNNDPSTGNVIDSSESDLPSDGAISGTRELHTDDDMQGQPQPQGGHGQMGGQIKTGLGISGQTSQQPQQTGPLPYGFQYPAGYQNRDPPQQTNYPPRQRAYQDPYSHQGQGNPPPFCQPFLDQNYNCWMYYDQYYGRILPLPVSQDQNLYQQQHGTPNRPVQGSTDTGVPGKSSEDHPGQHSQREQFSAQNPPPNQGYPPYTVPQGAPHHGPPCPTYQTNVQPSQGTAPSYQNVPHESILVPDSSSDQRGFVQDQYAKENKYPIKNAVSAPSDSPNPVPSETEREHPLVESEVKSLDESNTDNMAEPALKANAPLQDEENSIQIIEVKGLPQDVTGDTVSLYFENKRRSGGGTVEKIELKGDGRALVCFKDKDVCEMVLAQKSHKIQGKELQVTKYSPKIVQPSETVGKQPDDALVVRGCADITDDVLEIYFESKKSGGGEVKKLTRTGVDEVVVTFADSDVVESILAKASHKVQGNTLEITKYSPQVILMKEPAEEIEEGPADTIVVSGCADITDDVLEMYFESKKKSSGGEVKKLTRLSNGNEVIISFVDPEVCDNILNKESHTVGNNEVKVCLYRPKKAETVPLPDEDLVEEEKPQDTIFVRGCQGLTDDLIEMYFENRKKSGGGEISSLDRGEYADVALIKFTNPEVLDDVMKREHCVGSCDLEVTVYMHPREKSSQLNWNQSFEDNAEGDESDVDDDRTDDDPSVYVLKVTGLKDNTSEETLSLYFENRRRSGGDEVEKVEVDIDSRTALVYFTKGNVVERVIQKVHNLEGKNLQVSPYLPSKTAQGSDSQAWLREFPEGTVIKLQGVSLVKEEILQMYFESKKRSGGEAKDFRKIDDEVMYIIYDSPQEAKQVVNQHHVIEGTGLEASLYMPPPPPVPRPKYPDRFLIRGLRETTTKQALLTFLQEKCGIQCEDNSLMYGEEPGTVVVAIGRRPLHIKKWKKICRKRPLEGAFMEISDIPISNCILVKGLKQNASISALELYFESKRSGNDMAAEVMNCEHEEGTGKALVYFGNHKVIPRILQKEHFLDKCPLIVSQYNECLGESGGDSDPCWFKLPEPVTLEEQSRYKTQFIRETPLNRKTFEDQLKGDYATVLWQENDTIVLECMLRKEMKDSRKLIKTWKQDAIESVKHYMSMLVCEEMKVLNSIWQDVLNGLQSLKLPKPNAGKVIVLNDDGLIVVVAHTSVAGGLIDKVKKIVKTVEEEQERKKSEISETVRTINSLRLCYLLAIGFPNDMMSQFQGLRIEIKHSESAITFTGLLPDVKSAQIKMYENTNGLSALSLSNMSNVQMKFVDKKEVRQYIVKKLKAKQLVGVWESEKGSINILSKTDQEVTSVADILQQSVKEQMINLDRESVPLLSSSKWQQLEQGLHQSRGEFLQIIPGASQTQIVIVATDDIIAGVAEDVNNFIREKTIYSETIQYPRGIQRFLTQHMESDIRSIVKDLKAYTVDILFQKSSLDFNIKGTTDGLKIAMAKLDELSDKIHHKSHLFDKPGIGKLILSEKGKQYIGMIENVERCIVEREFDDRGKIMLGNKDVAHPAVATDGPQVLATWNLGKGRTLHVSQGDITQMNVDVIVNAANAQLAHIGGLARAIVEKGGESIQRESNNIVKRQGDVMVGEVAVTSPGRLPCKIVVHAVGPIWSGGRNQEEELLREAIFNSLEETNKKMLNSIAIPALSTGIYRYPVPKATRVIVEAIQTHFRDFPKSQVQDVYVCDNNIKTVNQFMTAVDEKIGKAQVQKQIPRHTQATGGGYQQHLTYAQADASKHYSVAPSPKQRTSSIKIKIVKGEIANQTVDAIVNTTSSNLVLTNGAVSKSILAAGGQTLQRECSMKYPQGINIGEVAVTGGGNLKCRNVFHTTLPSWAPKVGEKVVELLTEECLKTAHRNGLQSVAFPALGTGNLGYPRDLVAKVMIETIHSFGQQTTSVKEVRIIVYPSDVKTAKAFDGQNTGVVSRGSIRIGRSFVHSDGSSSGSGATASVGSASDSDWHSVTAADLETVFSAGKVQLTIKQGDITTERVNCIVNSTNSALDLSQGAVARSILNAGGEDLMKECDMRREEMAKNGVVVTRSFGLRCDYIVHVNAHHFQDMKKVVLKCLKAAGKSQFMSSVAFPALGTGQGFATVDVVSQQLVEAIQEYQISQSSGSIISDIRMVIFQKSMLAPFVDGVTNALKGAKKGLLQRAYDYIRGDSSSSSKSSTVPLQLQVVSDVTLYFFSDDEYSIANSIEKLNTDCKDQLNDRKIEDEDLKNLKREQRKEIENLAQRFSVKVDYQPRLGRVRLQGVAVDVSDASDGLQKILRNIHRAETEAEKAEMLASIVQWYFTETDNTGADKDIKYDAFSNHKIENAFKNNDPSVRLVTVDGKAFIIDFKRSVEYPENNTLDTVRVVRKDHIKGATFEPPSTWSSMTKESEIIKLIPGSTEYSTVEQSFQQGTAGQHTVIEIQRVQTKFLWQQYVAKKQQIDAQNSPSTKNERILWHGTAAEAIPSICKGGFNRSYCGKNATYYGEGVYFAVNATYSAQGRYSPPDLNGHRHMFQARVLTGEYIQGNQGLRVLPMRDSQKHIQYDSSVENMANPTMFVIFNDTQAYPDYLITFQ